MIGVTKKPSGLWVPPLIWSNFTNAFISPLLALIGANCQDPVEESPGIVSVNDRVPLSSSRQGALITESSSSGVPNAKVNEPPPHFVQLES